MPVIMFGNKELLGLIVDMAGQLVAIKYFNICASEWVLFVGFNLPWMYEELTSISIIYINYSFCFSPVFFIFYEKGTMNTTESFQHQWLRVLQILLCVQRVGTAIRVFIFRGCSPFCCSFDFSLPLSCLLSFFLGEVGVVYVCTWMLKEVKKGGTEDWLPNDKIQPNFHKKIHFFFEERK